MYRVINAIKWKFNMLKTFLWYKVWFGSIGPQSTICKPLKLDGTKNIYLGRHVRFREFARIEAIDQYLDQHFSPKLEIGDDTGFEQGLHLTCAGHMVIGKNVTVSAYAMITDIYHKYDLPDINVLRQKVGVKSVQIGDCCMIGFRACIFPGVSLGRNCIVGANSVVMEGTYPDYSVLVGSPAYIVKRYDSEQKKWRKTDKKGAFID